jgi:hypothetical protein
MAGESAFAQLPSKLAPQLAPKLKTGLFLDFLVFVHQLKLA